MPRGDRNSLKIQRIPPVRPFFPLTPFPFAAERKTSFRNSSFPRSCDFSKGERGGENAQSVIDGTAQKRVCRPSLDRRFRNATRSRIVSTRRDALSALIPWDSLCTTKTHLRRFRNSPFKNGRFVVIFPFPRLFIRRAFVFFRLRFN